MKTIERSWADPSFKSEIKRAIIFLLILFFVQLFAYILPAWSNHNVVRYYLSLHTLLELISIVISGMVFIVGWNSYGERLVGMWHCSLARSFLLVDWTFFIQCPMSACPISFRRMTRKNIFIFGYYRASWQRLFC